MAELACIGGAERHRALESAYRHFNHASFRASDPIEFVYRFPDRKDQEIAAWVAAATSFGRVTSIQNTLAEIHQRWEGQPSAFVFETSAAEKRKAFEGLVYRWIKPEQWVGLLDGWRVIEQHGSFEQRMTRHPDLRNALTPILHDLKQGAAEDPGYLVPDPAGTGACKRLAMWLRWMVRKDEIDPGLWSERLSPATLWVPLDTHMFRIAKRLRMTRRKTADGEAARRITQAFKKFAPEDPLKYDFAITRLGMGTARNETG